MPAPVQTDIINCVVFERSCTHCINRGSFNTLLVPPPGNTSISVGGQSSIEYCGITETNPWLVIGSFLNATINGSKPFVEANTSEGPLKSRISTPGYTTMPTRSGLSCAFN